ncbi:MAG: hypothetical protein ACK5NF_00275 [Bacilli bacterium]
MKKLNKKILLALVVALVGTAVFIYIESLLPQTTTGEKTITISFVDEVSNPTITIFENLEYQTNSLTLGQFLDEIKEDKDIKIGCTDSQYGRCIEGIGSLLSDFNNAEGPWILYSSQDNQSCLNVGYCPGIDELAINDGDNFQFTFTNTFE